MKFEMDRERRGIEAGSHVARIVGFVDIGSQEKTWKGDRYFAHECVVVVEFPYETLQIDGKEVVRTLSKFYPASLRSNSKLLKDLVAIRGRPFEKSELEAFSFKKILNALVQASVIINENGKPKIDHLGPLPKAIKAIDVPARSNELLYFDLDEFTEDSYSAVPEWLKGNIERSPEFQEVRNPAKYVAEQPATQTDEELGLLNF